MIRYSCLKKWQHDIKPEQNHVGVDPLFFINKLYIITCKLYSIHSYCLYIFYYKATVVFLVTGYPSCFHSFSLVVITYTKINVNTTWFVNLLILNNLKQLIGCEEINTQIFNPNKH